MENGVIDSTFFNQIGSSSVSSWKQFAHSLYTRERKGGGECIRGARDGSPESALGSNGGHEGVAEFQDNAVEYFSSGIASSSREKPPWRSYSVLGPDVHLFYLASLRTPITITTIIVILMLRKYRGEVIDHPSQGPDEHHHHRFNTKSPAYTFSPTSPPHPWWALYRTYLLEPLCDLASWKNAVSPDDD